MCVLRLSASTLLLLAALNIQGGGVVNMKAQALTFPTNGGRGDDSSVEACLECFGADVAYRRVTSLAIVPALDVLED